MTLLDEMQAICSPDEARTPDDIRRNPWRHGADLIATDARLFVVVREAGLLFPDAPDLAGVHQRHRDIALDILSWEQTAPVAGRTSLKNVRQWCGPYDAGKPEACPACNGKGTHCCSDCNHEHTCGVCEGERTVMSIPEDCPGTIAGVIVNRNLLAKIPASLTGECTVRVGKCAAGMPNSTEQIEGKAVILSAPDWMMVLMQMTADGAARVMNGKELPVFPLAAVEVK